MLDRYTTDEMAAIWSDEARFGRWLQVEIAIVWGWVAAGVVPEAAARTIEERARVDVERIRQIEETARHDVAAFVDSIEECVGEEAGRWVHFGITSSDVLDTALALQLREALDVILNRGVEPLMEVVKRQAFQWRNTLSMGRTHGVHAEPTSLGLMFAVWYDEMSRHRTRLKQTRRDISVGQVSGPVGTYASVPPQVEQVAMQRLDLTPATISTQIISRDRHASLVADLALVAASLEKFATEIRLRSRTEVGEFQEAFRDGQKGSSAMPHKKNPVLSENVTGLARMIRSKVIPVMENVALWHERDISHSSVERDILPNATGLLDFALRRITGVIDGLVIDEEALRRNCASSGGHHVSQYVLLELIKEGHSRSDAYEMVQQAAFEAEKTGESLVDAAEREHGLALPPVDTDQFYLEQVDQIFGRVFDDEQ